jgi:hypothetical protein
MGSVLVEKVSLEELWTGHCTSLLKSREAKRALRASELVLYIGLDAGRQTAKKAYVPLWIGLIQTPFATEGCNFPTLETPLRTRRCLTSPRVVPVGLPNPLTTPTEVAGCTEVRGNQMQLRVLEPTDPEPSMGILPHGPRSGCRRNHQ